MLTNILFITLLIVLVTITILILEHEKKSKERFEIIKTGNKRVYTSLFGMLETIHESIDSKTKNIHSSIAINKQMTLEIKEKLLPRIELQEKLIAELKQTQAPQEVSDTVSLINEWMNGATVEKK